MNFSTRSCDLQSFTLQQLRAATQAGGVASVVLKGQGNGFFIQIHTRTAQTAVLVTARGRQPRQFKSPTQAFSVLREIGIMIGSFDLAQYSPEQRETPVNAPQAATVPATAAAALASEDWQDLVETIKSSVQATLDDPALNVNDDQARQLYNRLKKGR
ncbi:hypothetical protein L1889_05005 [Paenalcaligenes niemegkensis]|uniref:hypothetical protein n=1 Tax=Paenalcaligenes niemegkensis TaxID=2895469 RepID=UPI001EE7B8AA|nr:hypothetical protein [Paenalcaligenes niemegkensis]MCQ9616139.1 hypothetical protein [Paenalcaligenes niemegkensis]